MKTITKSGNEPSSYTATINIGQNAKENDALFSSSKSEDMWFHLDKNPSAHVYLHIDGNVTKSDEKRLWFECCNLVRLHSKCNMEAKVVMLERKYLSKSPDCSSGQVIMKKKGTIV